MTVTVPNGRPNDFGYDVESYPNYFCCTVVNVVNGNRWIFEIFDGTTLNQSPELAAFLNALGVNDCRMIGFNVVGYDWPMLDLLLTLVSANGFATAYELWQKSQAIIGSENRWDNRVWRPMVRQLDLFLIHHFDNRAKSTSLKVLEFNMRSAMIEEIPHDPNYPLQWHQRGDVLFYNCHDVNETIRFYGHSLPMITFREELTAKYGRDFTNHNDTKIGKDYFIMRLEEASPGICYTTQRGRKEPRQTHRRAIPLQSVIFPYVTFQTEPFQRVLAYLKATTITNTYQPEEFKGLSATVRDNFQIDFGAGGIHGSVSKTIVRNDADHEILDVDVASYYPNLAIKNRVYPEHLSELFCDIYADLYAQRKGLPKTSSESGMLKLALNGVYGDSNNAYSPFLDPAYTMTITINGQLLICMLLEWLLFHPGIEPIQINTDGLTVRVHKDARPHFDHCYAAWQAFTLLDLETVEYRAMFIRDVNNYMAVPVTGKKIKRIGAYIHETQAENAGTRELWWNKDWSALVVPKAVQAVLVDGADLETVIAQHSDPFDFMLRERANSKSRLQLSDGTPLPRTVRYIIAKSGPGLVKIMPPTAKQVEKFNLTMHDGSVIQAAGGGTAPERQIRSHVGWSVAICNRTSDFDWNALDRRFYVEEARKLLGMVK